jgi:hypothetical protein
MAATIGIPRLVVLAAPQKHTATVSSFDILFAVMIRLSGPGSDLPTRESTIVLLTMRVKNRGGRAAKKHMPVNTRYNAKFMKTLKRTEGVERVKRAPVWYAPEKVVLSKKSVC